MRGPRAAYATVKPIGWMVWGALLHHVRPSSPVLGDSVEMFG
jgi:hypothetical protein